MLADLLKSAAPALATLVAGPLAGKAVAAMAEKLGVDATEQAVAAAIKADPSAVSKLNQIDLDELKLHNENTDSARKMNAEIQSSPNSSWLAKNIAYVLDLAIVLATIFLAWMAYMKKVPDTNKELVYMALGSLLTMSGTVLNFHRGSSQGSKDKNLNSAKG